MHTKEYFVSAYAGAPPPWDLGRAQRDLVAAFDQLRLTGSALDLGCGTGDNVLELAGRGLEAWGIDCAPGAIAAAQAKRAARDLAATFICGDALDMAGLDRSFDTVLDCGLFHVIAEEERLRYAHELTKILPPGGRFLMLGFRHDSMPERGPRGYSPEQLRGYLTGFEQRFIQAATYEANIPAGGVPAWLSLFERR